MSQFEDGRACEQCGELEDTCGPLERVDCDDGSIIWVCEFCAEEWWDD